MSSSHTIKADSFKVSTDGQTNDLEISKGSESILKGSWKVDGSLKVEQGSDPKSPVTVSYLAESLVQFQKDCSEFWVPREEWEETSNETVKENTERIEEVEKKLKDISAREEIEEALANFYNKEEIGAALANFYNKGEIDGSLANFYNKGDVDLFLSRVVHKTGDEYIQGNKTFLNNVVVANNQGTAGITVLPLGSKTNLGVDAYGLHVSAAGGLQLFGTHFLLGDIWTNDSVKMVRGNVSLYSTDRASIGFDYANEVIFRTMPNDGREATYKLEAWQWDDDSHTTKSASAGVKLLKPSQKTALEKSSVLNMEEGDARWLVDISSINKDPVFTVSWLSYELPVSLYYDFNKKVGIKWKDNEDDDESNMFLTNIKSSQLLVPAVANVVKYRIYLDIGKDGWGNLDETTLSLLNEEFYRATEEYFAEPTKTISWDRGSSNTANPYISTPPTKPVVDFRVIDIDGILNSSSAFSTKTNVPFFLPNVTRVLFTFFGNKVFNSPVYFPKVDNVFHTFRACTSFNQPVSFPNATAATYTFYGATAFNSSVDIPKITSLYMTFYGATSFNQPLSILTATHLTKTFYTATSFNQPCIIPKCENAEGAFYKTAMSAENISATLDSLPDWSEDTSGTTHKITFTGSAGASGLTRESKSVAAAVAKGWTVEL